MAKKNVSDLAKDLGVDVKHVLGHLERIGRKRTTPRTPLTEEEVERVRDLHAEASRPEIRIGEERTTMTETGVATDVRVSANVIKRRKVSQAPSADEPTPMPASYEEVDDGTLPPPPAEFLSEELPPLPPEIAFESVDEPLIAIEEESPEPAVAAEAVAEPEKAAEPIAEKVGEPAAPVVEPVAVAPAAAPAAPSRVVTPPPAAPRAPVAPARAATSPQRPGAPARPSAPSAPLRQQTPGRPPVPSRPPLTLDEPMKAAVVLGRIDLKKAEAARTAGAPARPGDPRRPVGPGGPPPPPATPEGESAEKKGRKKLKVIKKDVLDNERYSRGGRLPKKKRALPGKEQKKTEITVPKASKRVIRISDAISVGDLARQMGVKAGEILKKLMDMGMMATINQALDFDTATLVATDFEYAVENVAFDAESAVEEAHVGETETEETGKEPRPPVVTIMGHVDHGKTSLLDAVRQTKVTEGEAGGITQHIGAYSVPWNGRQITFVDTPGHEAFTAMRARGAKVTDIVILVVAADDGVMPQTREAIDHARAAKVPIIVAVNKIDRPDANLEKVKRELADYGLAAEDWGGDTTVVPVSAKTKDGLPELLEMILLQADVLDLKAAAQKLARGVIIEAKLERGRGPVATVLVQEGTLKPGDPFVCGTQSGRVRAMMDEKGRKLESAGPSMPVEVLGFQGIPEAGDVFSAMSDEATARQVGEHRFDKQRETQMAATSKASLENFFDRMKAGDVKELRVILKADVQGSVEAVKDALSRFSTEEVKLSVIHAAVGAISETDVNLASASEAIIIGFNIRPEGKAADLAEREGVEIRLYTIIYDALRDVHAALEGLLEPIIREKTVGRAEVKQPFPIPGLGTIAGSMVTDGKITKGAQARLVRDSVQVWRGKVSNLRRFKDDVREVLNGLECGIQLENYNDVKPGDVIELFETEEVARRLAMPSTTRSGAPVERHA